MLVVVAAAKHLLECVDHVVVLLIVLMVALLPLCIADDVLDVIDVEPTDATAALGIVPLALAVLHLVLEELLANVHKVVHGGVCRFVT